MDETYAPESNDDSMDFDYDSMDSEEGDSGQEMRWWKVPIQWETKIKSTRVIGLHVTASCHSLNRSSHSDRVSYYQFDEFDPKRYMDRAFKDVKNLRMPLR